MAEFGHVIFFGQENETEVSLKVLHAFACLVAPLLLP